MRSVLAPSSQRGWSDVSNSDRTLSPSRLATYVECPRQYEYQYDLGIDSPPDRERYKNRGIAYHETIAAVCDEATERADREHLVELARELFDDRWGRHCCPDTYSTRSHYEYDRALTLEGIEAYFESGPGLEHAKGSIATERTVETEYKRSRVGGRIDNVVETDDGLLLIDYKGNLRDIVSSLTAGKLSDHLAGETYRPKLVGSAIQAAVYLEGIRDSDLYEKGMELGFVYYGLLDDHETVSTAAGIVPEVSGKGRDVTNICLDNHGTIWQLIRESWQGINTWSFDPEPWPEIYQSACEECGYKEMCPDFLGEEVRVE